MTFEIAQDIRRAVASGESQRAVALRTGVSRHTVRLVVAGRAWSDPTARPTQMRKHRTPEEFATRFWSKITKVDGCWEWPGDKNARRGYGRVSPPCRPMMRAHRFAWESTHGQIPEGFYVLHRCDNPPCVNPAHLFLGTHADNIADMLAKGRSDILVLGPRGRKGLSADRARA